MSAFTPKADIEAAGFNVRFDPKRTSRAIRFAAAAHIDAHAGVANQTQLRLAEYMSVTPIPKLLERP